MTTLVRVNVACDYCDAILEPAGHDVLIGVRGIHPSQVVRDDELFRDRLPSGWEHWSGQDGETYDACPSCAPTHSWA